MRTALAIIVGAIGGFSGFVILGTLGVALTYGAPRGLDPNDSGRLIGLFLEMPAAPKLALLVALVIGGLLGAAIAKRISGRTWPAWVVAALMALYFALSILSLPLPGWAQAATILAPLVGGLIGNHLVAARAPEAPVTTDS